VASAKSVLCNDQELTSQAGAAEQQQQPEVSKVIGVCVTARVVMPHWLGPGALHNECITAAATPHNACHLCMHAVPAEALAAQLPPVHYTAPCRHLMACVAREQFNCSTRIPRITSNKALKKLCCHVGVVTPPMLHSNAGCRLTHWLPAIWACLHTLAALRVPLLLAAVLSAAHLSQHPAAVLSFTILNQLPALNINLRTQACGSKGFGSGVSCAPAPSHHQAP
jgi:hypothetical protein